MAETDNPSPATSAEVRAYLARALDMDLIGPPAGHALDEERIPGRVRPSNWYLTGFLVPTDAPPEQTADADEEEELDETPAASGLAEESAADRRPARRGFLPSSIGSAFWWLRTWKRLTSRSAGATTPLPKSKTTKATRRQCGSANRTRPRGAFAPATKAPTTCRTARPAHPRSRTPHRRRQAAGNARRHPRRLRLSGEPARARCGAGLGGHGLRLPSRARNPQRAALRAAPESTATKGRRLGRPSGRPALCGYARVRHRPRRRRGLGVAGRQLPGGANHVDRPRARPSNGHRERARR